MDETESGKGSVVLFPLPVIRRTVDAACLWLLEVRVPFVSIEGAGVKKQHWEGPGGAGSHTWLGSLTPHHVFGDQPFCYRVSRDVKDSSAPPRPAKDDLSRIKPRGSFV